MRRDYASMIVHKSLTTKQQVAAASGGKRAARTFAAVGLGMAKSYIAGWEPENEQLRLAVLRAFDAYTTTDLIALLGDAHTVVRTVAAQHLHLRGGMPAFKAARALAHDDKPERRAIAAFLLGQLGTPARPFLRKTLPILSRLMDDPDAQVRACAVWAFGCLGADERRVPKPLFAKILVLASDPSPMLREAVTDAMGLTAGPEARATLERLATDAHRSVRRSARFWLADRMDQ